MFALFFNIGPHTTIFFTCTENPILFIIIHILLGCNRYIQETCSIQRFNFYKMVGLVISFCSQHYSMVDLREHFPLEHLSSRTWGVLGFYMRDVIIFCNFFENELSSYCLNTNCEINFMSFSFNNVMRLNSFNPKYSS